MLPSIISTERLSKSFGSRDAVRDVNLSIPPGSLFAFLGPNGAGKTTTIRLLLGLLRPSQGSIAVHELRRVGPSLAVVAADARRQTQRGR